jgi:hypothetical protein
MTLTEFLLARIAEDEAWLAVPMARRMIGGKMVEVPMERLPAYVERDRSRWLAECEVKRLIIRWATLPDDLQPQDWADEDDRATAISVGRSILRALASVYADHPDFQREWRTGPA